MDQTLNDKLKTLLPFLEDALLEEIISKSAFVTIPPQQQIVREGQFIKTIPLVLEGLVKVTTSHGDREILLYYIQPTQSCIMSFSVSLDNEPSKISAYTEEQTEILLLPLDEVKKWVLQYPSLNELFFKQFNLRYRDMIETIGELIFDKLDQRLLKYLQERARLTDRKLLEISHREIAEDLATSREVITRTLKKLEEENHILQMKGGIKVLA